MEVVKKYINSVVQKGHYKFTIVDTPECAKLLKKLGLTQYLTNAKPRKKSS